MKKAYTKPAIMFEAFTLSTNIAACANEAVFDDSIVGGCKAYYDDQFDAILFTSVANGCKWVPADNGNEQLCYDVPTISYNLFGS